MTRPSQALIDLNALLNNYRNLRALHGGKAFAVLKANAYGHGAVRCAKKLEIDADAFAVAFLEEGLELREAGIQKPILLLEGVFDTKELRKSANHGLWLVVNRLEQLEMIEHCASGMRGLNVWLKLETGMNRLGIDCSLAREYKSRLSATKAVSSVGFMTHLACADVENDNFSDKQIEKLLEATKELNCELSFCNSAAVITAKGHRSDWARLGIAMYGVNPVPDSSFSLEPVMELKSTIFAVKNVKKGEGVGYGCTARVSKDSRVGIVALGYADGYPRKAMGCSVMVGGLLARTFGAISMDMLAIDITELQDVDVGAQVELWGKRIHVAEVAQQAQTIPYELLCNVKRVGFHIA
jgi:alanine racemase